MKYIILLTAMLAIAHYSNAQSSFTAIIKSKEKQELLAGTTVIIAPNLKTISGAGGIVTINNIAAGKQVVTISFTGYKNFVQEYNFPIDSTITIELENEDEELDEVIVQSTRTSRSIQNTTTRIETIDGEELDEKNNMRPANVSMLLHESTGIRVQQTSATSANSSIRIQGLDGRYTQLLKDGYPNFGSFASGLSIIEIPPLDLQQVEVIKGPSSTLYGGGAIAGVVNFISKKPKEKAAYNFLLNQSHIGQTNIGSYSSQRNKHVGYSLLALVNFQKAYDVDKDDFSELPKSTDFTINPTFYFYPSAKTSISLGNSFTKGERTGGDMQVIKNKPNTEHTFFEKNNTLRNTSTAELNTEVSEITKLAVKQSVSLFDRKIAVPAYTFKGFNTNTYSEVSLVSKLKKHTLVTGANFIYDNFKQKENTAQSLNLNATTSTAGAYVQDTWDVTNSINIEAGLRLDNVGYKNVNYKYNKTFVLPRIASLFKITNKLTSRIGAGLGYKAPTIFTEQSESFYYKNLLPLTNNVAEKSIGFTADINYKTNFTSDFQFAANQLFFYTRITNPLVLQKDVAGNYFFSNSNKTLNSKGFETNLKFIYKKDLKLFVGYTFTDAKAGYLSGNQKQPLIPKGQLNLALIYEKENNFKLGLEGYRTGQQYLYNGMQTPAYWELGFMAEKAFHKVSFFINFENFTNTRQSKYKNVVNPPHNNPTFDDIWTHVEGFVMNGGIKIKL